MGVVGAAIASGPGQIFSSQSVHCHNRESPAQTSGSVLLTDPLTGNTGSRSPQQNCSRCFASGIKYAGITKYHKYNLNGQMYRLCQRQPILYHDPYRLPPPFILYISHIIFPRTINSYGSIVYTSSAGSSLPP